LGHNHRVLRRLHGGRMLAVPKANAYGHGAAACARALPNADGSLLHRIGFHVHCNTMSSLRFEAAANDDPAVMTAATGNVHLRPMQPSDLEAAHALSAGLKWPHRLEDWRFALVYGAGVVATRCFMRLPKGSRCTSNSAFAARERYASIRASQ
jgi:hypothetical protein